MNVLEYIYVTLFLLICVGLLYLATLIQGGW